MALLKSVAFGALLVASHAFSGPSLGLPRALGPVRAVSSAPRTAPAAVRMGAEDVGGAFKKVAASISLALLLFAPTAPMHAETTTVGETGASFKVLRGASSTQDSGSRRTITRGTVLDNSVFTKQNLKGISFQQSLCRSCDFSGSKLTGASFFDGDLSNANMEGAELSSVNPLPVAKYPPPLDRPQPQPVRPRATLWRRSCEHTGSHVLVTGRVRNHLHCPPSIRTPILQQTGTKYGDQPGSRSSRFTWQWQVNFEMTCMKDANLKNAVVSICPSSLSCSPAMAGPDRWAATNIPSSVQRP